jgi:hypothetical protein
MVTLSGQVPAWLIRRHEAHPMNRELIYLGAAALLPLFNRFQEVSVLRGTVEQYRYAVYNQVPISIVCFVVCCLLLVRIKRGVRKHGGTIWGALPLRYCWFALPAFLGFWSASSFGDSNIMARITAGIGGPYALLLFVAAGLTFVCVEGYLRQMRNA